MIPYNPTYTPPAPALLVHLIHTIRSLPRIKLPALIDTGADATAIPLDTIDRLNLYPLRRWIIEEASGTETHVNSYAVRLAIVGQEAKDIEVIPTALPLVILGRDWLADYYLYLNERAIPNLSVKYHPSLARVILWRLLVMSATSMGHVLLPCGGDSTHPHYFQS